MMLLFTWVQSNNAATFILDMLKELGVTLDEAVEDYVAERLSRSQRFVDRVKNNPNAEKLVGRERGETMKELANQELMKRMVVKYITDHY